jgi:cupin fold WbuC family metalloprotein
MNLEKINDEVFYAQDPIVCLGTDEVVFLKAQAKKNHNRRSRICAHRNVQDGVHEMIIAIYEGGYIHPHRHIAKSESFYIIEGEVDIVLFDLLGNISEIVLLGDIKSGRNFFYRLSDSHFHTLILRSEYLVFHEVTNGPFDRSLTLFADFAPHDTENVLVNNYSVHLDTQIKKYWQQKNESK